MTLRWRQPRITDAGYLAWLREQRCACGCLQGPPCDAAHVRSSSLKYNKRPTGFGERPDDRWALPLKHSHHMAQHAFGSELAWWQHHGVNDVFKLCLQHYDRYQRSKTWNSTITRKA
jgi:hypothetical protein